MKFSIHPNLTLFIIYITLSERFVFFQRFNQAHFYYYFFLNQVFKCSMAKCSKVFKELDSFLEHIKEHECEMTYRCHICSKTFVSLYELGLHQYTHSLYPHQGPKTGPRSVSYLYNSLLCLLKHVDYFLGLGMA